MIGKHFDLTEKTLPIVEEIGGHMPGGFFIYKAEEPEDLIYANKPVFDIVGCADLEEFKELKKQNDELRQRIIEYQKDEVNGDV